MPVSAPKEAFTNGPYVLWKHIDGPLMEWAGHMHWLTLKERARIFFGLASVDQVACERWPHLAKTRATLQQNTRG